MRRQSDAALSIFFTVLTAYAGYVIAEEVLHVSGVLGAVVSGLYSGWNAHSAFSAGTRLSGVAFWGVMTLGLEALLFVLLGLQVPQAAGELDVATLILPALAVAGCVIAVRLLVTLAPGPGSVGRCASARWSAGQGCAGRSPWPPRWPCRSRCPSAPRSCS